ncbi:MAG TPA: D-amino acid dehydrogenase [Casimicrobiaceae bacterium]
MNVTILGSGVIGVSVAYNLAKAGHQVLVVDRQPGAALETSFGNAGEISPGYAAPWAGPRIPLKALRWAFMRYRPLVVWPLPDPAMWRWMLQMLRNCTSARYDVNKTRMLRLAEYSRDCLRELRTETGIRYSERSRGTLQLFRTQKDLDASRHDTAILDRYGVRWERLDRDGCIGAEPALARVREKFVGGLRLPGDETGDCHQFTTALAKIAQAMGVRFRFDTAISRIEVAGDRVSGIATAGGRLNSDAYVVALGSYSPLLVKPIGIDLPVYPVKGYSITVPITDAAAAPESTVMDETFKVAVTRLDDRIRVGGTAELAGYSRRLREGRRATLEHVVRDLFPDGGDLSRATFWTGLRPMTPDGTPVLGPTRYPNLYLATGHGTLGWTMSAGTGRVLADIISSKKPAIDMAGLTLDRYAGSA